MHSVVLLRFHTWESQTFIVLLRYILFLTVIVTELNTADDARAVACRRRSDFC